MYHQDSILIISQQYHNERALYQALHLGVDATAYNAHTLGGASWLRNRTRECLARVKPFFNSISSFHYTDTINPFTLLSLNPVFSVGDIK
ncbi:MAG: hypothetical protein LIP02_08850 [Bacteroidales bacterium]|nr:hypothetical protein [Bacteroidales bacterium]